MSATLELLCTDWLLAQCGVERSEAQRRYRRFVAEGVTHPAPWEGLRGQIFLNRGTQWGVYAIRVGELFANVVKFSVEEAPEQNQRERGQGSMSCCTGMQTTVLSAKVRERLRRLPQRPEPALEGIRDIFPMPDTDTALYERRRRQEILKRLGTSRESAGRLARKAAEAEAVMGIHGVSVTAGPETREHSWALRLTVASQFRIHDTPTRRDPLHRTVELPKPVA